MSRSQNSFAEQSFDILALQAELKVLSIKYKQALLENTTISNLLLNYEKEEILPQRQKTP